MLVVRPMRAVLQLGTVMLLLGSYLTPVMACMVSDVSMNPEERACCRAMQGQCGQMEMPASHGCCQKAPPGDHNDALSSKAATLDAVAVATDWLDASVALNPVFMNASQIDWLDSSPPTSPPATVSILRI